MDKMTNGTKIELNETGTSVFYTPGLLVGGDLEHECSLERGVSYYLEAVMMLAPFCKKPVNIKLRGITNNTLGTTGKKKSKLTAASCDHYSFQILLSIGLKLAACQF